MREYLDTQMSKHKFKTFDTNSRSSFEYWYYHWKAFNLVAWYLRVWKFKYLFHDIEKPWLRLFLPYKKVQSIHRRYNSHHKEYREGLYNVDVEAMVIDNECSRFTKDSAKLNAREFIEKNPVNKEFSKRYYFILGKLGL